MCVHMCVDVSTCMHLSPCPGFEHCTQHGCIAKANALIHAGELNGCCSECWGVPCDTAERDRTLQAVTDSSDFAEGQLAQQLSLVSRQKGEGM